MGPCPRSKLRISKNHSYRPSPHGPGASRGGKTTGFQVKRPLLVMISD